MSELAVAAQSGSPPVTTMLRRTVAVVDMVGYSDVARMLEQNISALSVSDLNRQIQTFITQSLNRLPNPQTFCVVARTGDGIIVLFEKPDDAHDFAYHVHLFAAEHNNQRSEATAERWFRIGIATGDVSTTACVGHAPEFAGTAIANAVRLESAAKSGEILIDLATCEMLATQTRLLYASQKVVRGKRKERFLARRFRVSCPRVAPRMPSHPLMSRRVFLGAGAAALASGALTAWLERDRLYARLHPLPDIRHIALMAWPTPSKESEAMLAGIIDSIHARLIHAEAYTEKFMIVTAEEVARSLGPSSPVSTPGRSPQEAADQWGANLILAANLTQHKTSPTLELKVLDTTGGKLYRQTSIPFTPKEIARTASNSAARLLDLPVKEIEINDDTELANQPPAARNLYAEATLLAKDPNRTKTPEALQKYLDLAGAYPHFSLAHSGVADQYLLQYKKSQKPADLEVAGQNVVTAFEINPNSEAGHLVQAKFFLLNGDPLQARDQLAAILRGNPMNTDAVFTQAEVFEQMHKPEEQEAVYRALIRNRPNFWPAYNNLGNMFHKRGNNEGALENYSKASARAPNATFPLINLGTAYLLLDRTAEAKAAFEHSIRLTPNESAFENLGNIAFKQKDYPGALQLYQQALDLSPTNFYVFVGLGDTYEKLNQPQQTQRCYREAARLLVARLKVNPRRADSWMTLAFYHAKIQDRQAAEQDIRESEQRASPDVNSAFIKARTLMLLGRNQEAEAAVLQCLAQGLSPTEVELAPEFDAFRDSPSYTARSKSPKPT